MARARGWPAARSDPGWRRVAWPALPGRPSAARSGSVVCKSGSPLSAVPRCLQRATLVGSQPAGSAGWRAAHQRRPQRRQRRRRFLGLRPAGGLLVWQRLQTQQPALCVGQRSRSPAQGTSRAACRSWRLLCQPVSEQCCKAGCCAWRRRRTRGAWGEGPPLGVRMPLAAARPRSPAPLRRRQQLLSTCTGGDARCSSPHSRRLLAHSGRLR